MAFSGSESGWRISRRRTSFSGSKAGTHTIFDPKGRNVGYIQVVKRGRNNLFIENIYSDFGPGSVGYRGIRDLARQLRQYYKAKSITFSGNRISGARDRLGVPHASRMTSIRFSGQEVSILGVTAGKPGGHAGYGV